MKKSLVVLVIATSMSINAHAGSTLWKVAGLGVAGVAAYGILKGAQPQKQLYCISNDKLMHIIKNSDHVYLDDKGRPVPCNPNK